MKKITKNVSFGKFAVLFNVLILCMFIISMICLLNFDHVNMKLVRDTPAYENAVEDLRKVESPRRQAQAEVDYYAQKMENILQQEIPTDKKKVKEHDEEVARTTSTLEAKQEELAKIDEKIQTQMVLFEAVKAPFDDLTNQVNSSKSTFKFMLWITILLFVVKVACFSIWKYNSLVNLRVISPWMKKSASPHWAYLGWIIPILNFIKPYTVYNEIINETHYALSDKNIIENDSDVNNDFNLGLWWGLFLVAALLMSFFLNGTFFKQGALYFKLSHIGVVVAAIIFWALYLLQECSVIYKGIKMNQILFENRSKFDLQ
jgi:hypothetical protein